MSDDVKSELREEVKKPYSKPEVVRYGSIQSLTSATAGAPTDGALGSAVS